MQELPFTADRCPQITALGAHDSTWQVLQSQLQCNIGATFEKEKKQIKEVAGVNNISTLLITSPRNDFLTISRQIRSNIVSCFHAKVPRSNVQLFTLEAIEHKNWRALLSSASPPPPLPPRHSKDNVRKISISQWLRAFTFISTSVKGPVARSLVRDNVG